MANYVSIGERMYKEKDMIKVIMMTTPLFELACIVWYEGWAVVCKGGRGCEGVDDVMIYRGDAYMLNRNSL